MKKMLGRMFTKVSLLFTDEKGQGMVEYALIIVFIALVVVAGVTGLGTKLSQVFTDIVNGLTNTPAA